MEQIIFVKKESVYPIPISKFYTEFSLLITFDQTSKTKIGRVGEKQAKP